jgi:hypothetical protein
MRVRALTWATVGAVTVTVVDPNAISATDPVLLS